MMTENPRGFLSGLLQLTYSNPLYNYTLKGRNPPRLLGTPPELLTGNAATGQSILAGLFPFQGRGYGFTSFRDLSEQSNEQWLAFLHSFKWLSDLRRVRSKDTHRYGQELIAQWLEVYDKWDDFCWRPDILGARVASWISHFAFLSMGANQIFLNKVLCELGRQSRHLSRSILQGQPGHPRITALKGLIYAGIALPQSESYLVQGMAALELEVNRQRYPDGGHISRNPSIQKDFLRDLLEIESALTTAYFRVPNWLKQSNHSIAETLQGMRLGDGGLARFNGGRSCESEEIETLLSKVKIRKKAPSAYLRSGFHRLEAAQTVLVMDVGTPPARNANRWGHAGALSFELSAGKERLIVNCGATGNLGEDWHQALRSTAAHSTVCVDDVNSAELDVLGGFKRIPTKVNCSRRELGGKAVIDAETDGYEEILDLIHRRIIMMSSDGSEILGEDQLQGTGGRRYILRFHLHPNVQATLIQHGKAALLKPRRGAGWKFAANNQAILIEDSIYLDRAIRPRRSQQLIVNGELLGRGASIKWSLRRT